MNHSFSWRKLIEAVLLVAVLYNFLAVIGGGGPDIPGTIIIVPLFALVYGLASKGLEKLSDDSEDNTNRNRRRIY
ncbi:hypothetical protein GKQ38_05545 [Candidatus Nanohaloarchaea archaeon]|nr:hypothetical protein GKQ38_05545 [Candidatus Nanohaloarchaea archaeon]